MNRLPEIMHRITKDLNQELHTASIGRAEEIRRDLLQIKVNVRMMEEGAVL